MYPWEEKRGCNGGLGQGLYTGLVPGRPRVNPLEQMLIAGSWEEKVKGLLGELDI